MPLVEESQRSQAWLDARKGKITASLAAACLGLDPYKSRQAAWREILGHGPGIENRHMRWGVQFEAAARLQYEADTGYLVETTGFWVHDKIPWLGASPDGLVGQEGLCEIKCPGKAPERVPIHHRIQCLIQLAVLGRQWCDYYSWGADTYYDDLGYLKHRTLLRRVYRAGIPGLILRLDEFRRNYVVIKTEPPRRRRRCKLSR